MEACWGDLEGVVGEEVGDGADLELRVVALPDVGVVEARADGLGAHIAGGLLQGDEEAEGGLPTAQLAPPPRPWTLLGAAPPFWSARQSASARLTLAGRVDRLGRQLHSTCQSLAHTIDLMVLTSCFTLVRMEDLVLPEIEQLKPVVPPRISGINFQSTLVVKYGFRQFHVLTCCVPTPFPITVSVVTCCGDGSPSPRSEPLVQFIFISEKHSIRCLRQFLESIEHWMIGKQYLLNSIVLILAFFSKKSHQLLQCSRH